LAGAEIAIFLIRARKLSRPSATRAWRSHVLDGLHDEPRAVHVARRADAGADGAGCPTQLSFKRKILSGAVVPGWQCPAVEQHPHETQGKEAHGRQRRGENWQQGLYSCLPEPFQSASHCGVETSRRAGGLSWSTILNKREAIARHLTTSSRTRSQNRSGARWMPIIQ
jgi:hypothetical protein